MTNKFATDTNLDNNSFNIKEFVGETKTKPRRILLNFYVNEEEQVKVKKLASQKHGGNMQAFFRSLILPALDEVI